MGRVIYAILTNESRVDKLYLLASKEIYTDFSSSWDSAKNLTRTLDYYTAQGVTISSYSGAIKKNGTSASYWHLRLADSSDTLGFLRVSSDGHYFTNTDSDAYGVYPAFRLG